MIECSMDSAEKILFVERLDEEGESSRLHDRSFGRSVFVPGDEYDSSPGRLGAQMGQQLHSGHRLHPNIQNEDRHNV